MILEEFQKILPSIPTEAGIYQYYDKKGNLLYVGKAKNIKKRVSSYFSGKSANQKTTELVSRIQSMKFTIVPSETDALFLENTLIKNHQPVFNIELKDDKTYPYIVIKNEPYPRIFLTRRKYNDGSTYLGPYSSVGKVRSLIEFIRQHLPIRTCKLPLNDKSIAQKKFKKCLEYQLGNCNAPCEGLQSREEYQNSVDQIKYLLNGNLRTVIRFLKDEMKTLANQLQFEKAAIIQKKIEYLENYQSKSTVVNQDVKNCDVIYLLRDKNRAFLNFLMVRNGMVIESNNLEITIQVDESDDEVLATMIVHFRERLHSDAPEIITPFPVSYLPDGLSIATPKRGAKYKLLEMSRLNALHLMREYDRKSALHLKKNNQESALILLQEVQELLHLKETPFHIECFDNSNFQGSYPVAAMVCYKEGIPSKKDYRKFNIKTVKGINDFASMKEIVFRRYSRLKKEKEDLPQLIIIDGGKGQLSAACESIRELNLTNEVTLIGLAKNVEEIFFVGDTNSLKLPINHPVLLFLRRIRDEVHRFGISFHRDKRSKNALMNQLENIRGLGDKTIELLLKEFRSVENIEKAESEKIENLIGKKKTGILLEYIKRGQDRNPAPY